MPFNSLKKFLGIKEEQQKIQKPKKIIQKPLSSKVSNKSNTSVTKFFLLILKDFFSSDILSFIKPKSFKKGVLQVCCQKEYMLTLNDRKNFFIKKIQKHFGNSTIKDIIFIKE